MRLVINLGRPVLVGLLACSLAMHFSLRADEGPKKSGSSAATEAEDLPHYAVQRAAKQSSKTDENRAKLAEDRGPSITVGLEVEGNFVKELDIPFVQDSFPTSSRRNSPWTQRVFRDSSPGLFAPDDSKPLKPLAGEFSQNPIWRADYIETWGVHPATPVPSPMPRWGVLINDLHVVPVAAEEEIDASGAKAYLYAEKCEKCGKCASCQCENCPGKGCKGNEAESQSPRGDAAKVILELMETLGRSVLDGTVFQKEDKQEQEWLKELSADGQVSPREALIQYIRLLEAQEEQARTRQVALEEHEDCLLFCEHGPGGCPSECRDCPVGCHACPAACRGCPVKTQNCTAECCSAGSDEAPCLCDGPTSSIELLREMAIHMEMAANELERREIYNRADQLREVAGHLRQDARQTSVARASHKAACHCPPQSPRDVLAQLHELQEELRRAREELEQARQQRYSPLNR